MFTRNFLICLLIMLSAYTMRAAAAGSLDQTFGYSGIVTTDFTFTASVATNPLIQPDGKIVVVGSYSDIYYSGFAIARYNSDGSLDSSFGIEGKVTTAVLSCSGARAAVIQPDGKIVAGGVASGPCSEVPKLPPTYFAMVRYNSDGTLDASFGNGGKVITNIEGNGYNDLAIQSDGKIVAVGSYIHRYHPNGSLDTSFGNGLEGFLANSVEIQSNGKIVIAGSVSSDFGLARLNPDGSLDTTFGAGGISATDLGADEAITSLAIQSDGRIVATGRSRFSPFQDNSVLLLFKSDGSLDTSFGVRGVVWSESKINSIALQPDGKIISVGRTLFGSGWIARHNPNGSPDVPFGNGGNVSLEIVPASSVLEADGKIICAGGIYSQGGTSIFSVARLNGKATWTPFDFDGDGRSDISIFRSSDSVWYLNQSTAGFSATPFGLSTDKLVPADYDGDGKTDLAVFRDGTWWRLNSSDQTIAVTTFGQTGDVPIPGDYTGDGRAELAIYRSGQWWSLDLSNNQWTVNNFGIATDRPVPGDYDGDGKTDIAVVRTIGGKGEETAQWWINGSTAGVSVVSFGPYFPTNYAVPADYDGDGKTDPAFYYDHEPGLWVILQSTGGIRQFEFGLTQSPVPPVPADYDGDGKTDAAVYRNGTWYIQQSTNGIAVYQFGNADDKPVPTAFLR